MNKVLAGIEQGKVKFSYEPYKYFPDFPRIHVNAVRTQPKGFEVPDQCSAIIQVLTVPGMTPQSTLQDIQQYIEELKSVPLAKGFEEVFYPGEIEANNDIANRRDGLQLPDDTLADLARIARECGLESRLPFVPA